MFRAHPVYPHVRDTPWYCIHTVHRERDTAPRPCWYKRMVYDLMHANAYPDHG